MGKIVVAFFIAFSSFAFLAQSQESQTKVVETPMEVANECLGQSGKPFRTYSKFYFKADGTAYGLRGGQEIAIKVQESHKKFNSDGSINYVETLNSFKIANGITADVCGASSSVAVPVDPSASAATPAKPNTPEGPNSSSGNQAIGGACNVSGQATSVVLAMSWQPAFCEGKPGKPECKEAQFLSEQTYHASNFTLHGLWPNKSGCGINYGFCGDVKKKENNFCDYPDFEITDNGVDLDLKSVMPSRSAKSCLERHEWHKHGTCQSLDTSKYFGRSIALVKQFNASLAAELVRKNINSKIKKSDLIAAIDTTFGSGASKHFIIICKKQMLTEIQINLKASSVDPQLDESKVSIVELLDKSAQGYERGCGKKADSEILIDKIGQQ